MNEIISKRTERNKVFNLGDNKRRLVCHCKPIHYKLKERTGWEDINLNFREETDKFITDENKVSVGFRKDKKLFKYFGVRYDYEHQFEGTIKGIKLDNVEKLKSDLASSLQRKSGTEISHQLNSEIEIINRINEVSLKNFVKINNPIEDFTIVEELHLKGLICSNQKKGIQYIPDRYNRFNFVDEKGELKFWINQPFFEDKEGESYQNIQHTLHEINGHLIYIKTPTKEGQDDLILTQYPILIDTNTYYSSTSDGEVHKFNNSSWDTTHDAETGQSYDNNDPYDIDGIAGGKSGQNYQVSRAFFYFDTQNLPDAATITGAVLKIYGKTNASSDISAQEGTQADTLTVADFDACSPTPVVGGGEYGHVSWVIDAYNSITFNADGKSDINKTGTTKICCREYDHDYLDVDPSSANYQNGLYWAEYTETAKDPKLEIDYTEGDSYRRRVIISGFMKIKQIILIGGFITVFMLGMIVFPLLQKEDCEKDCKYYVWHKNQKECITEQLKEYIENIEQGDIDRLKSKRGIKIEN